MPVFAMTPALFAGRDWVKIKTDAAPTITWADNSTYVWDINSILSLTDRTFDAIRVLGKHMDLVDTSQNHEFSFSMGKQSIADDAAYTALTNKFTINTVTGQGAVNADSLNMTFVDTTLETPGRFDYIAARLDPGSSNIVAGKIDVWVRYARLFG